MDKDGVVFRELLNDCTSPVFAYCRSGTRSITLWALSSADTLSYDTAGVRVVHFGTASGLRKVPMAIWIHRAMPQRIYSDWHSDHAAQHSRAH